MKLKQKSEPSQAIHTPSDAAAFKSGGINEQFLLGTDCRGCARMVQDPAQCGKCRADEGNIIRPTDG